MYGSTWRPSYERELGWREATRYWHMRTGHPFLWGRRRHQPRLLGGAIGRTGAKGATGVAHPTLAIVLQTIGSVA